MSQDADRANSKPPSLDRRSLLWRRIHVRFVLSRYGANGLLIVAMPNFCPSCISSLYTIVQFA